MEIPITVFMYTRRPDGSVIQKDYFYDETGNLMVEEIYNSIEILCKVWYY